MLFILTATALILTGLNVVAIYVRIAKAVREDQAEILKKTNSQTDVARQIRAHPIGAVRPFDGFRAHPEKCETVFGKDAR